MEQAIRSAGGELLRSVRLFDLYRGAPLAASEQSLNWRLAFQADDHSLTDAEVDARLSLVTERLADEVGGRIRS